jgi:glycosyltransferase involved in cell wall biosynthesis
VLGPIADDRMPALMRAADVFAFPSEREGFGLVVLEAQAAGLPCVVSDLPVLREFLADGRDCLMVPAGDAAALGEALSRAIHDGPLRERLAAGGRSTAAAFTWEAAAAAHEALYERILRG